jgi:malonate-semialdehyde dehydrogenase (acetylating) / methylmalonate-semialdehyde dehydrogenase
VNLRETMGVSVSTRVSRLGNYYAGAWHPSAASEFLPVVDPATDEVLAEVPMSSTSEASAVVDAAAEAFPEWRRTPPEDRIQYLFKLKDLLERNLEDLARQIIFENGKTLAEARAELRRGVENVEVACGIPTLMQGFNLEDVARGIDEIMIRQPLGVTAAITPFNFPAMIPLWFLPYAIACGNTFILKPSEKVPLTMQRLFALMDELHLPPGVLNLLNGGKDAVDTLLSHPQVRGISFVGSTPVAKYIYAEGARHGKRVQCQGGAKNHVVIMPDAEMDSATQVVVDSAFGCAGQRCLAVSVAIAVGDAHKPFRDSVTGAAAKIKTGPGIEESNNMGPVINHASKQRIESLIAKGVSEGAKPVLDGRGAKGNFVKPTVLDGLPVTSALTDTEIFGPVLSVAQADSLDAAIKVLSASAYGNAASIFTTSGAAARKFRYDAPAGNIGVNIGVAAPMAYFPFSGWKDSFLGVLHGQGRDAVEFYTEKKVVIERWPKEWSRKF